MLTLNHSRQAFGLSFLCAAASLVFAQPLFAEPIEATFNGASLVSSMPDGTCPAPAHSYGTYAGAGSGLFDPSFYTGPGANIPFTATISLSTCEITGVPAKGVFSIASGTASMLSGNFFFNGALGDEGSYQFTAESGIFAGTDTGGYFFPSIADNKLSLYLITPEPATYALIGVGLGISLLLAKKRRAASAKS